MNIMKTNMLLLDNKIMKDDAEKSTTVAAPVPSPAQPQAGMRALMFQGLQNLMADPELAQEVGVTNDEANSDKASAKSYVAPYSSNIAFQGKSLKQVIAPALIVLGGLFSTAALTSCEKTYITQPEAKDSTVITVTVTNESTNQLVAALQATLLDMLAQQKLSYEQFAEYMNQTNEWRNQTSAQIAGLEARLDALSSTLISMGDKILTNQEENNAYQQILIAYAEKLGMSADEIKTLIQEGIIISKQNGKTGEDGMKYIINELQNINTNLGTIIGKMDVAYVQRQNQTLILEDMRNRQVTKEQVDALNENIKETSKTYISIGEQLLAELKNANEANQNGIAYLTVKMGWSTAEVQKALKQLGVKVDNNTATVAEVRDGLQEAVELERERDAKRDAAYAEYQNDKAAAADWANKVLDTLQGMAEDISDIKGIVTGIAKDVKSIKSSVKDIKKSQHGIFVNGLIANDIARGNSKKLDALNNQIADGIEVLKSLDKKADQMMEQAETNYEGLVETINQAVKDGEEAMKIMNMHQDMRKDEIVAAIKNFKNTYVGFEMAELNALGGLNIKLGKVAYLLDKRTPDNSDVLDALKAINDKLDVNNEQLEDINVGIENANKLLEELSNKADKIYNAMTTYFSKAQVAMNNYDKYLADITAGISDLRDKINVLIAQGKLAANQRTNIETAINNIKAEVAKLNALGGNGMTVEQFKAAVKEQRVEDYEFLENLFKKYGVGSEYDLKPIEDALGIIIEKLDYQAAGNTILNELLAYAKKYPDKMDEIKVAIENHKCILNCDCKASLEEIKKLIEKLIEQGTIKPEDAQVHEGEIHIIS